MNVMDRFQVKGDTVFDTVTKYSFNIDDIGRILFPRPGIAQDSAPLKPIDATKNVASVVRNRFEKGDSKMSTRRSYDAVPPYTEPKRPGNSFDQEEPGTAQSLYEQVRALSPEEFSNFLELLSGEIDQEAGGQDRKFGAMDSALKSIKASKNTSGFLRRFPDAARITGIGLGRY